MTDDTADDRRGRDLDARVAALEDAVDDLRAASDTTRRDVPRGPRSFPRPPTPREFLAFAVDDAIPATVALLDAQVRALEALRAALRLVDAGRGRSAADAAARPDRETLDRLDAALADLRAAVSGDALPKNHAARDLLEDARDLTADLEAEVAAARADRESGERADEDADAVTGEDAGRDEREHRAERVEDELDQLRDEYDAGDDVSDADGGGRDADDDRGA